MQIMWFSFHMQNGAKMYKIFYLQETAANFLAD